VTKNGVYSVRDIEVLDFIIWYSKEYGWPPSVREIGQAMGMSSPSTVQAHIVALKQAGFIERGETGSPRTIRVLKHPHEITV
jgi:SOS-response transcriptional repressor LexA